MKMPQGDYSRREFLKQNSIAGLGIVLSTGIPPSLLADFTGGGTPAILGGKPVLSRDWPNWPLWNSETDEKRVVEVLRSGVWSRRDVVTEFENKWAETLGVKRCLAVVNGTNALMVALVQYDIGAGDEVIVPPYTFIGAIAAVLTTGAMPIFVDTNPATFQIDVTKIEEKITSRTRAIMPVHLAGMPADLVRIMEIAKKHDLIVVEDACQAHLAEINHQKVGTFGHAGCFSFQNSKNLPIGEGGAIVSNNEGFMDHCYAYHNFGNPFGSVTGGANGGTAIKGNKLRLTEYQAAIGLAQLARLEAQTKTRTENAEYLRSQLQHIPGIIPYQLCENVTRAAYHLFPFRYKKEEFQGLPRTDFLAALQAEGVPCSSGYATLNTMPYLGDAFNSKNYKKAYPKNELDIDSYLERNKCPENDKLCKEEAVWFFQNMLLAGKSDMDGIFQAIGKIHKSADKIKKASNR